MEKRKEALKGQKLRINGFIRAKEVRVIGVDGHQIGVLPLRDAQMKAQETGSDLVEVSPTANPPVCRIMDFGKYKYQQSKKEHNAKVHHKEVHLKEIQFRPFTGEHDREVKVRRAREFLLDKQKVKIALLFRGREMSLHDRGEAIMGEIIQKLRDVGNEENALKREGRNMMVILAPKPGKAVSHPAPKQVEVPEE